MVQKGVNFSSFIISLYTNLKCGSHNKINSFKIQVEVNQPLLFQTVGLQHSSQLIWYETIVETYDIGFTFNELEMI